MNQQQITPTPHQEPNNRRKKPKLHSQQTSLRLSSNSQLHYHPNSQHWGNRISDCKTHPTNLRIAFRNIRSLPSSLPDPKHDQLISDILSSQTDIFGMVETNLFWPHVNDSAKPLNRYKPSFEKLNIALSYNCNHPNHFETRQPGGTLILTNSDAVSRIIDKGYDNTRLGRWSWVRYRGKQCIIRVVCVYRPVNNQHLNGTFQQHSNTALTTSKKDRTYAHANN